MPTRQQCNSDPPYNCLLAHDHLANLFSSVVASCWRCSISRWTLIIALSLLGSNPALSVCDHWAPGFARPRRCWDPVAWFRFALVTDSVVSSLSTGSSLPGALAQGPPSYLDGHFNPTPDILQPG